MKAKPKTHLRLTPRIWANVLRTRPWIVARIILIWLLLSPWFLLVIILSAFKAGRWSRLETCRAFMKKHELAFLDIDPSSIRLESLSGGISNSNHFWHCKTRSGRPVTFFVKVFVSVGTFWARNLSLVSPFPEIYGISTTERFAVDIASRVLLAERGVAVPRLMAFDAVQQVMVTEYVQGENVDKILTQIDAQEKITEENRCMIEQCGSGLGKIHVAGYSLIDTQPINCMWSASERRVYFTDLEFCTQSDKRLWDVAFFLCFLVIRLHGPLKNEARAIFLKSYEKESGLALGELNEAHERLKEFLPILQTILDIRQFKPEDLFAELVSAPA